MIHLPKLPFLNCVEPSSSIDVSMEDAICRSLDALAIPKGCLGQLQEVSTRK